MLIKHEAIHVLSRTTTAASSTCDSSITPTHRAFIRVTEARDPGETMTIQPPADQIRSSTVHMNVCVDSASWMIYSARAGSARALRFSRQGQ